MSNHPVAWMESPYGVIRANPLYRVIAPVTEAWSIPLYPHPPIDDTALLRQALVALNTVEWHGGGGCYIVDAEVIRDAIEDLRERLGENT